jgi:transcriptional regulator with XRE-family HTH domain
MANNERKSTSRASFAVRLRKLRNAAGMSQTDLERASGIPKSRISRYENGHLLPSIGGLRRLAQSLDVADSALLGDREEGYAAFVRELQRHGVTFEGPRDAERAAQDIANMLGAGRPADKASPKRRAR